MQVGASPKHDPIHVCRRFDVWPLLYGGLLYWLPGPYVEALDISRGWTGYGEYDLDVDLMLCRPCTSSFDKAKHKRESLFKSLLSQMPIPGWTRGLSGPMQPRDSFNSFTTERG